MCWIPFTLNTTSLVPCRSLRNITVKLQHISPQGSHQGAQHGQVLSAHDAPSRLDVVPPVDSEMKTLGGKKM